jgi:hypothetical protein
MGFLPFSFSRKVHVRLRLEKKNAIAISSKNLKKERFLKKLQ